ncbi:MAG: sigma-54-dependent Fis family transcriptional regulator [Desulfobacteraceae bacterium]|nr:MAG: sigma-54-dependent Fis family transcriptional regulator [Desulfobacteraceae bacterium]
MNNVLIIDDDPDVNRLLSQVVSRMGGRSQCAETARQGMAAMQSEVFDLVLLDVRLPDGDGLQMLPQIREARNAPEVIIITGNGDPDAAEMAIHRGAWDYLIKPSSAQNLMVTIQRALTYRRGKHANPRPRALKRDDIVGDSPGLNAMLERVAQAAEVTANVLISGETGTGKELLARSIHENSPRAEHRFVTVDCAALPATLVESVLFGYAKGAFTGAEKEREGLIRQAHGGTLFLDEIGELPLAVQKAFLRVIQERCVRPIGGTNEIGVNFRLLAATNRDLDAMAQKGLFRSDLLFRLRSFSIEATPLRRRLQDIKSLALHQVARLCDHYQIDSKAASPEFLAALQKYDWPGNVRELFHTIEEAFSLSGSEPTLYPHHFPTRLRAVLARNAVQAKSACTIHQDKAEEECLPGEKEGWVDINTYRRQMEQRYLRQLLRLTAGNRKEACRLAGLSRTRLFELLKKYDLGLIPGGD